MTVEEALQAVGWVFLGYSVINIFLMLLVAKDQNNNRRKK